MRFDKFDQRMLDSGEPHMIRCMMPDEDYFAMSDNMDEPVNDEVEPEELEEDTYEEDDSDTEDEDEVLDEPEVEETE
jgi:hypothetical protein